MLYILRLNAKRLRTALVVLFASPCLLGGLAWHAASWRPVVTRVPRSGILSVDWTPDGSRLRVRTKDSTESKAQMFWFDVRNLAIKQKARVSLPKESRQWDMSPNGKILVAGVVDTTNSFNPNSCALTIFDTETGRSGDAVDGFETNVLLFSPDGTRLLAGAYSTGETPSGQEGAIKLFEMHKEHFGRDLLEEEDPLPVDAAVWMPGSRSFWLALRGGELINMTRNGKETKHFNHWHSMQRHERHVTALAIAIDANTLAMATEEEAKVASPKMICVMDAKTGSVLDSWHPATPTTALAFTAQGDRLAVADAKTVVLHPTKGGTARTLSSVGATALAFSPDGSRLAIGTSKGDVQIWRVR